MTLEEAYSKNRTALKKIKNQSTVNGVICGLYLCTLLFEIYYAIFISPLYLMLGVLVTAGSVTGFAGIAKKDNRLSITAFVLVIIHLIAFTCITGIGGLIFSVPGYAVLLYFVYRQIRNNKEYRQLEQEEGFPHFEIKQTMYDMDKRQRAIKDPFQTRKEELEKRTPNVGHMDEL